MQNNYDFNLCYKCKIPCSQLCKCLLSDKGCQNGHVWVECPTHSTKKHPRIIISPKIINKVHNNDFKCENNCYDTSVFNSENNGVHTYSLTPLAESILKITKEIENIVNKIENIETIELDYETCNPLILCTWFKSNMKFKYKEKVVIEDGIFSFTKRNLADLIYQIYSPIGFESLLIKVDDDVLYEKTNVEKGWVEIPYLPQSMRKYTIYIKPRVPSDNFHIKKDFIGGFMIPLHNYIIVKGIILLPEIRAQLMDIVNAQ